MRAVWIIHEIDPGGGAKIGPVLDAQELDEEAAWEVALVYAKGRWERAELVDKRPEGGERWIHVHHGMPSVHVEHAHVSDLRPARRVGPPGRARPGSPTAGPARGAPGPSARS